MSNLENEKRRLQNVVEMGGFSQSDHDYYDNISRLASELVGVPVSLVSIVEESRQFFVGEAGLNNDLRETPLSHSFCKHVVNNRNFLIVEDAREHDLVKDNLAIRDLDVIAYLGAPIATPQGEMLGSFCAIDNIPRKWTKRQITLIRDFAKIVADHLSLRIQINNAEHPDLDEILHDLRTPLTAIHLSSVVLADNLDKVSEPLQPLVTSLATSSEHMKNLIEKFATNTDEPQYTVETTSLAEVVDKALARIKATVIQKSIDIELGEFSPDLKLKIESWKLERILDNLLSNAVKFTENGGIIHVWPEFNETHAGFGIRDCGPGFTDEDMENLYQRYGQLSAKPTAGEVSTGLGLSIVKTLVDENHGLIELIRRNGKGAEFRVMLPRG